MRCALLPVIVTLAAVGSHAGEPAPMPEPAYAPAVYPRAAGRPVRATSVPYTETDADRVYGFDTPFPGGARASFAVEDFGAKADGITDCTPAFYRALAAAKEGGGAAEVVFASAGRYRVLPHPDLGSDDLAVLNVRDARNLLIRGQGDASVVVVGSPELGGLRVIDGETVMVRDLALDYNPLPFTQGTVREIDAEGGTFLYETDSGYPGADDIPRLIPGWGPGGAHAGYRLGEAGNGAYRWLPIGFFYLTPGEKAADRTWRCTAETAALKGLQPGNRVVYVGRRLAQMALGGEYTAGFYVKDVTVLASPTCGLGLSGVDGVSIDGYVDAILPGSDRLLASNADGIFCNGVRGGITVRNSSFMGQGDDCINLHCPAFAGRYVTVEGDRTVIVQSRLNLKPGDSVEIMNPAADLWKGALTVTAVEPVETNTRTRLTFTEPLASVDYNRETDSLYPEALACSNFKIVNNAFGQNRSRCLLIQARNGLIAGNTFENAEGYGVVLGYGGTAWPEGVIPRDVVIRANLFRNVTNVGLAATIQAAGTPRRYLRNLTIEDNRFVNPRKMTVCLSGVDGAVIAGNRVSTEAGRRNTWNHPEWFPVDCSIYLDDCTGIVIDRFELTDPELREAGICIRESCDPGEAGVRVKDVRATLAPGVPALDDRR